MCLIWEHEFQCGKRLLEPIQVNCMRVEEHSWQINNLLRLSMRLHGTADLEQSHSRNRGGDRRDQRVNEGLYMLMVNGEMLSNWEQSVSQIDAPIPVWQKKWVNTSQEDKGQRQGAETPGKVSKSHCIFNMSTLADRCEQEACGRYQPPSPGCLLDLGCANLPTEEADYTKVEGIGKIEKGR